VLVRELKRRKVVHDETSFAWRRIETKQYVDGQLKPREVNTLSTDDTGGLAVPWFTKQPPKSGPPSAPPE
jgi:hypothetical protein